MRDLTRALGSTELDRLRSAYDGPAMRSAMTGTLQSFYAGMQPLTMGVQSTFYGEDSPLAPAQRESCMVALLTVSGPPVSLAIHVYWALMEGLSVDQVCHIIALGACYGGMSRLGTGLPILDRTLGELDKLARGGDPSPGRAVAHLVTAFSGV